MSSGFKADEISVRDIFANSEDLRMPPYQRGYSWTEKEAGDLLSDLREASTSGRPYFLGAIVIVQAKSRDPIEIVDGQQRLSTLTLLLSVLRDMSDSREESNRLHEMIESSSRGFLPGSTTPRWRLTLNHIDTPFFRETVQKRGATLNADNYQPESESRQNILQNLQFFRDAFKGSAAAERTQLANFILKYCMFVRVKVADRDGGYGAFRVLNTRGKQPSAHDILKSDLFERAGFSDKEAVSHSVAWNEFSHRLGSHGFDDLLKNIRTLFDKPSGGDMVTGFREHVISKIPARVFVEDYLPRYVDAYEKINGVRQSGSGFPEAARHSIDFMRCLEHVGWRSPALKYLMNGDLAPERMEAFFNKLERLAFAMQFVISDRDARTRRYKRVSTAIDTNGAIWADDSPLELSADEKRKLSERLIGRFATFKQRKAMSIRINALVPNGAPVSPDIDATLEHIMPRNPKEGSYWLKFWPNQNEHRELVDCLGNFTLLTNAENQEADRSDFSEKKAIFFRNQSASFNMSDDIADINDWTPDIVRARRDKFADLLRKQWDL